MLCPCLPGRSGHSQYSCAGCPEPLSYQAPLSLTISAQSSWLLLPSWDYLLHSQMSTLRWQTYSRLTFYRLKKKSTKRQIQPEVCLTRIDVIQALQQKLSRFRGCTMTGLATFLLHELTLPFPCADRFLLVPELSASVKVCEAALNDVLQSFPTLRPSFYQVCRSLCNSFKY